MHFQDKGGRKYAVEGLDWPGRHLLRLFQNSRRQGACGLPDAPARG